MKYLQKGFWCLLTTTLLFSCVDNEPNPEEKPEYHKQLVEGAREFYEEVITEAQSKGTLVEDALWHPGKVTPCWDNVYFKRDDKFEYVMVPIEKEHKNIAQLRSLENDIDFCIVHTYQFICVRRSYEGKYSMAYISLIPDAAYYNKYEDQVLTRYLQADEYYGDFSGRIFYNNIVTFKNLAIDKVQNGNVIGGMSSPTKDTIRELFLAEYHEMVRDITHLRLITIKVPRNSIKDAN